jgi:polysaccharide export outer membrane protein
MSLSQISIRSLPLISFLIMQILGGCARTIYPPASPAASLPDYNYRIGPGDSVNIFVWRNPELSTTLAVRPDGKITVPLVEDLPASGKTPTQLARDIEKELAVYVREPIVTVIVAGGVGPYDQQIRVVGEAAKPQALAYREKMTLLDVMIQVGGLTEFASGNRASIVRMVDGQQRQVGIRIDDLIKDGDITANVEMFPGDILIIPEAWF